MAVLPGRSDTNAVDRNFDFNTWVSDLFTDAVVKGASDVVLYTNAEMTRMDCEIRIHGDMYWLRAASGPDVPALVTVFRREAQLASAGSQVPQEAIYPVKMPVTGDVEKARAVVFKSFDGAFIAQLRLPAINRVVTIDDLKLGEENLDRIKQLLASPGRMIMIAGPMGAGKSSTVHGMIDSITGSKRTIWTIEDPVERKLPGTFQLQADENNGYGFSEFLPHMVRSDYDTLFIGEIRDKVTAAAAVRQSKAGRQIITTIHANDNIVALLRLIELAEDTPLAVLDSVKGVVSQRLVPALNPKWDGKDESQKYTSRRPINEVLMVDREIVQAFMDGTGLAELRRMADETGKSTTFFADAARLVDAGHTDWAAIGTVLGEYSVAAYVEARERGENMDNVSAPVAAESFNSAQESEVEVTSSAKTGAPRQTGPPRSAPTLDRTPSSPAPVRRSAPEPARRASSGPSSTPSTSAPARSPRPMRKRISAAPPMPPTRGE